MGGVEPHESPREHTPVCNIYSVYRRASKCVPNVLQTLSVHYCTYIQFKIKILNKRIIYLYNDMYKQHLPTTILPCR